MRIPRVLAFLILAGALSGCYYYAPPYGYGGYYGRPYYGYGNGSYGPPGYGGMYSRPPGSYGGYGSPPPYGNPPSYGGGYRTLPELPYYGEEGG